MPRCVLRTILALLVGLLAALPSYGLFPRPEPFKWPTLEFIIYDADITQTPFQTANDAALRSGEILTGGVSKQIIKLKSPLIIRIRGYALPEIDLLPITPETETVLLIDEIYNPDLPNGGITDKSHIIREKPNGGWVQRFLDRKQQEIVDATMALKRLPREKVLESIPITQYPTLHMRLEPYEFTLPPGKHTIQVLMLNADGTPMNPPITSRYATVIILPPDINYWPIILGLAGLLLLAALAIAIIKYHRGRPLGNRP